MSLIRRGESKIYSYEFSVAGHRYRGSTGTTSLTLAKQFEAKLKEDIWGQIKLGNKPRYGWFDAVERFCSEMQTGRTTKDEEQINKEKGMLAIITEEWGNLSLEAINANLISQLAHTLIEGRKPATVNRYLAVLKTLLRKACYEWEWTARVPRIKMFKENNERVRWLTRDEALKLLSVLPPEHEKMARFALATGVRQRNLLRLQWSQIDLEREIAWFYANQTKNKASLGIPLNKDAMAVLLQQLGKHTTYVFASRGCARNGIDSDVWKRALGKAELEDFKWHDLRHTWASWHVQAGTPIHVLKELGGWKTLSMVLRYAHLSVGKMADEARNIENKLAVKDNVIQLRREVS